MAFGLKGLPVEIQVVLEDDADALISRVGKKAVPVLERDDGTYMPESMDIVRYIDACHPEPKLAEPTPAIDTWCDQAWPLVLKLAIPRFTRGQFPELETDSARQAYLHREQAAFGDLDALIANTDTLLNALQPGLEALETLLETPWHPGYSDIKLFPILRMLSIVRQAQFGARTSEYMTRVAERSGVPLLFDQAI